MLMKPEKVQEYISWDDEVYLIGPYPVYVKSGQSVLDVDSIDVAGPVRRGGKLREVVRARRATAPKTSKNISEFGAHLRGAPYKPTVLVIGGGQVGLGASELYDSPDIEVIAFDIYGSSNVHFIADGHDIPIRSASVDGVVIQAVLEHVLDPAQVVAEIVRVLKPNGLVYAETPFMQHVHEGAYDFTRFTLSGHRWLFRRFDCLNTGALTGPATNFVWAASALATGLFRARLAGRVVKMVLHWLTQFDKVIPEPESVDGACAVYFLGRLSSRELSPLELIDFYRGAQT